MDRWGCTKAELEKLVANEDELWERINYVYNSAKKTTSYKFGLIKSILDNLINAYLRDHLYFISYEDLFTKFTENYWNLIVKYHLRQIRKSAQRNKSSLELIIEETIGEHEEFRLMEFSSIGEDIRKSLIGRVARSCKRNVLSALYNDFGGIFFSFDFHGDGINLSPAAYEFLIHYSIEIEKLNYYGWAKFLEEINDDNEVIRVLDKLEMSTPQRKDLSAYRLILQKEFEENTCFYCGKKLVGNPPVDHFIPWKFTKEDRLWNFVLCCKTCNSKKSDRLPTKDYLDQIILRNGKASRSKTPFVVEQFRNYDQGLFIRMWKYARYSGFQEYKK